MFTSYVKIALRHLTKFKGYAATNILGLAIGIACCLLIVQYLRIELSYDQHHKDLDRIYRVETDFVLGDKNEHSATSPCPLAKALKTDFAEVEESTRLLRVPHLDKYLIRYNDASFYEERGIYADSNFFSLLQYDFVQGEAERALAEPFNIVLSKKLAGKLFGDENPMSKTVSLESAWGINDFKVTGIIDRSELKSHIDGEFFVSMRSGAVGDRWYSNNEWAGNNLYYTYIKIAGTTNVDALESKLTPWMKNYAGDRLAQLGFDKAHTLHPVSDSYFNSNASYAIGPTGNRRNVYILGSIALFILIIACINFMNLATAKSTARAHEVGVRKVIGASRSSLTSQFLGEALVYSVLSVVVALTLAKLAAPFFSDIVGQNIKLNLLQDPTLAGWLIGIILITTIVAGSYPALYLSSFSPSKIFRGHSGDGLSAQNVRKGLVVLQFVISIGLIQGVLVINQQLNYCMTKDLGFNADAKLVIPLSTAESQRNYSPLKNLLLENSMVDMVGGSSEHPGRLNIEDMILVGEGQSPEEGGHAFMHFIDPDYLTLMDFKVIAGRGFDESRIIDTLHSAVISETLVNRLGYTVDNAPGKTMYFDWDGTKNVFNIIGVIADFHSRSLHNELDGEAFMWYPSDAYQYMIASVSSEDLPTLIALSEEAWQVTNPGEPFEYYFMDEKLNQNYLASSRVRSLVLWGTFLAVFISCLGLLGLASFAADKRRKELGIRRVLGASTTSIISLMSRDFTRLVIVALILATPIAWYMLNTWLGEFQYHITMPWWSFVIAGIAALLIALLTVSIQTMRSQAINPVESLKSD